MLKGLEQSLKNKKKKKQLNKRLNLVGEEDGGAQFFSLEQIMAAREFQASKEAEEAQRQQNIINKKAIAAANKQKKEAEKLKRAKIATERRSAKTTEMQLRKEAKKAAKAHRQRQLTLPISSTVPIKAKTPRKGRISKPHPPVIASEVEVAVLATSRGRRVQRPQRFNI